MEVLRDWDFFCRATHGKEWIFAKTMPQNPHWYVLRKHFDDETFDELVRIIRRNSRGELFRGREYRMLDLNGYKHWTMGAPVEETTVINRKPLSYPNLEIYDSVASLYDQIYSTPEYKEEDRECIDLMMGHFGNDAEKGRWLDIGCGTGILLEYLFPEEYCGIEPSRGMIEVCKSRFPDRPSEDWMLIRSKFEHAYAGSFDFIVSLFGSASYIDREALRRIPEMLREGGKYFLMTYKSGYVPSLHNKPELIKTRLIDGLPGKVMEWRNYLVHYG